MTSRSADRPIALTMGDPAGIGLDITLAAFAGRQRQSLPAFALFADPRALHERARSLALDVAFREIEAVGDAFRLPRDALAVVPVPVATPVRAGTPDSRNAAAIIAAIDRATAAVMAGEATAIVTNPIAKATLTAAGFKHPGHTEFLAELASRHRPERRWHPVMMLACETLRVVPLTIHVPLARVAGLLTADLVIETVRTTAADLTRRFAIPRPRIAVAGLNPHAGESGTLGREEIEIIAPAVARLRDEGFEISGPHSADTMFHTAARARFDVALCMYHDQALIPIKTLAFDTGVNVTLGLPFVRTSPDHGTAFDIAGSGRADPASLVVAMQMAARMAGTDGPGP